MRKGLEERKNGVDICTYVGRSDPAITKGTVNEAYMWLFEHGLVETSTMGMKLKSHDKVTLLFPNLLLLWLNPIATSTYMSLFCVPTKDFSFLFSLALLQQQQKALGAVALQETFHLLPLPHPLLLLMRPPSPPLPP